MRFFTAIQISSYRIEWKKQKIVKIQQQNSIIDYSFEHQINFKKQKYEQKQMSDFLQAHIQNNEFKYKQTQQTREGDWICTRCNNLNFSFRKRCNRCKVQSKQQNDVYLLQVYQYYQQYYSQVNTVDYQISRTNEQLELGQHFAVVKMALVHQLSTDEESCDSSHQYSLPSVSPIVDRYKKEKTTPKTSFSECSTSEEKSFYPNQFYNEYCWRNILVDQEVENQLSVRDAGDFWDSQIEKLVQNIVI